MVDSKSVQYIKYLFMFLASLDREAVAAIASEAVLVLPIGATEQHGPALPLGTDTMLVDAVVQAACARLSTARPVVVAPTVPYGNSAHHLFACAGSVSPGTLLRLLGDLIDSFIRSGFRRIFLVNGHGGNDECVRLAVKDAVNRHPVVLGAVSYWTLAGHGALPDIPGHAGAFEASLLLAARPDALPTPPGPDVVPGPRPVHEDPFGDGVVVVRGGDWAASGGFTDPPGKGSAAAGVAYLDSIGEALADVLRRFSELPLRPDQAGAFAPAGGGGGGGGDDAH